MSKKPDVDLGLATGIKYWLVFMLGFALLGYRPFLSITFGAIGGIASGMIAAWLKPKDTYEPTKAEQVKAANEVNEVKEEIVEPVHRTRFRKYGTSKARRHHSSGRRYLGWFFGRKS